MLLIALLLAAVTFSTLQVRPREQPAQPGVAVINSTPEWEKFTDGRAEGVDFSRHTVVAVFAGEKPTGGYSVQVTQVEKEGDACVVHHRVTGPPRDAMVAQVITYPSTVVRLDAKCSTAKLR